MSGIIPPLVTPLTEPDTLDVPGLERLVEHVVAGGVSGLFILGSTGEGPSLGYRLRRELIDRTCRQAAGRVPVLVGVTDTAFVETVALAEHAAVAGAAAVVVSAPYYFSPSQAELYDYVEHLAPRSPLPVFLYNMPGLTKVSFDPETVGRAVDLPNVVGLKDSSGTMAYFHHVRRLTRGREGWSLLVGPEELLAESILLGGDGGVPGGANCFPRLYVDLYDAARRGDLPRTRELQRRVMEVSAGLYMIDRRMPGFIRSIKCALACLGVCGETMAEPFGRLAEPDRDRVRRFVEGRERGG